MWAAKGCPPLGEAGCLGASCLPLDWLLGSGQIQQQMCAETAILESRGVWLCQDEAGLPCTAPGAVLSYDLFSQHAPPPVFYKGRCVCWGHLEAPKAFLPRKEASPNPWLMLKNLPSFPRPRAEARLHLCSAARLQHQRARGRPRPSGTELRSSWLQSPPLTKLLGGAVGFLTLPIMTFVKPSGRASRPGVSPVSARYWQSSVYMPGLELPVRTWRSGHI